MKKHIVRRTFSIDEGVKSNRVDYLSHQDFTGGRIYHTDINNAMFFNEGECPFSNQEISGDDRSSGKYSYKQEVLNCKIEIEKL